MVIGNGTPFLFKHADDSVRKLRSSMTTDESNVSAMRDNITIFLVEIYLRSFSTFILDCNAFFLYYFLGLLIFGPKLYAP